MLERTNYTELVNAGADAYFRRLMSVGWLNEWHEEDIEILQGALKETESEYMLFCLSEYTFNPEGICTANSYKTALLDMCNALGIFVKPEEIKVSENGAEITILVETESGKGSWTFTQEDDWAHENIFEFINDELLEAMGEDKVIYPLPPAGTELELVFVYPEVLDLALEAGVIPEDDYFVTEY